jgi:putative DNA primase/helicase
MIDPNDTTSDADPLVDAASVDVAATRDPDDFDGESASTSDDFSDETPVDIDFKDDPDDEPLIEKPAAKKPQLAAESDDDPHRLGRNYLDEYGRTEDGTPTLAFYRGEVWRWTSSSNCYEPVADAEIRGEITKSAKAQLDASAAVRLRLHLASGSDDKPPTVKKVTRSLVGNVLNVVESVTGLPSKRNAPFWLIDDEPPFDAGEVLVAKNGLVHLPSLGSGQPSLLPPTPLFFSTNSLGCLFDPQAACLEWLRFLATVWGDDEQSIETLAEWFGYLLLADVSHHKILLLVGPPRSGKGTIGRVLKMLLGQGSVANPTMSSLAGPFGLWPLLNKMAAIISDARLSDRHVDSMAILERLLSISGGDPQNIDRKCLPTVTAVMMAVRFTILSNEIPRLTDASGAIASRFLILQMTRSFLGKEDKELDRKLAAELSGILNWAIRGWQRLRERGRFLQPESGADLLKELRDIASPVGMFVREVCAVGPEWSVDVADIYAAWCDWCKQHGRDHAGTEQAFGKDLRAAVPGLKVARPRTNGDRVRRYKGIGFNPQVVRDHSEAGEPNWESARWSP